VDLNDRGFFSFHPPIAYFSFLLFFFYVFTFFIAPQFTSVSCVLCQLIINGDDDDDDDDDYYYYYYYYYYYL